MFRSPVSHRLMMCVAAFGLVIAIAGSRDAAADEPNRELRAADRSRSDAASVQFHAQRRQVGTNARCSMAIRAGRRSCSSSWETTARSATSTCRGLIELNREFRKKGVVFLGINSNAHETEKDVAKFVAERGIDFPVLKDPANLVADSALVERTCEVIVLDGSRGSATAARSTISTCRARARTRRTTTTCATP